ncbi:nucleoside triphosphate pyrophosphatase [Alphaproteobacteria bacterium LSUCC0684]
MLALPATPIILATASPTRQAMLRDAGLSFISLSAAVDEESLRKAAHADGMTAADAATLIAEMKARQIARQHPEAFVIGADQLLECEGIWYAKPTDRKGAKETLRNLSGRTHHLVTAAVVFKEDQRLWHQVESPAISMRRLTEGFISSYLDAIGPEMITATPGVYQIETLGAHLLSRIEGSPYAVLGLPLLPLLAFLREHGLDFQETS